LYFVELMIAIYFWQNRIQLLTKGRQSFS